METIKITPEFLQERPLSYSALKEFRKSPKHYQMYLKRPRIQTDAMLNGSVVDTLLLEPEKFEGRYLVADKPEQRSNAWKEEWARVIAEAGEKTVIPTHVYENAMRQVESVMAHPIAGAMIERKRKTQVRIKWTHKATGLPMIGYVDLETEAWESLTIVDLKTGKSSDPEDFIRDAGRMDYHLQVGAYLDGYPRCYFRIPNFAFIVVENDEPYNVSVFFADAKYLHMAKDEFHGTMNAFKYCMDNDLWKQGYDFRMFGTREYFEMTVPKFLSVKFQTVREE